MTVPRYRRPGAWPLIWLIGLNLLLVVLFQWRNAVLEEFAACNGCLLLPDGQIAGYTAAQLQRFFDYLGPQGSRIYALSELTLDGLFPPLYAMLFLALLYRAGLRGAVCLLPLPAVLLDWGENLLLAAMATGHLALPSFAPAASMLTVAKYLWIALLGGLLLGGLLLGGWLRRPIR